jgi:predicted dehydrogenase
MRVIRWGLIGCGDVAYRFLGPAFSQIENCELNAVNSRSVVSAEAFAQKFGVDRRHGKWQDLVADDEIDAVYVATPHHIHAQQTIAAADAGKQVLCEKPMAMNSLECGEMIDACSRNGVKLGVAYYRHFYPVMERLKQIISNGSIGKIVLCQINSFTRYDLKPGDAKYWMTVQAQSGGGPVMAGGCHRIEMLLDLFGPIAKTKSVLEHVLVKREVEDTAVVTFTFENGPVGVLSMSQSVREPNDTLYIFGSEGSIHMPVFGSGELFIKNGDETVVEHHPPNPNGHLPLIESFCQSVRNNETPVVDGQIGREVQKIEDAVYGY